MGLLPLALGSGLWLLGLLSAGKRDSGSPLLTLEYAWCYAAFTVEGVNTFASIAYPTVDGNLLLGIVICALAVAGGALFLKAVIRDGYLTAAGGWLFALLALLIVQGVGTHAWQTPALSLLLFLPVMVVPAAGYNLRGFTVGARHATVLLLVLLVAAVVLRPTEMLGDCRLDKCSAWGVALGPGGTGNALGLALAVTGIITLLETRTVRAFLLIAAGSGLLVDLTSSRSAAITWGVGILIVLVYNRSRVMGRPGMLAASTAGIGAVVAAIPFGPWAPNDFTYRAELWQQAITLFQRNPVFGYGASYWVNQPVTAVLDANYATHNLLTEMLVSGGLVGAALFAVAVVAVMVRRGVPLFGLAVMALTIGACLTEVVSAPGRLYVLPGLMPFAFLTALSSPVDRPEPGPVLSPESAGAQPQVEEHEDVHSRA